MYLYPCLEVVFICWGSCLIDDLDSGREISFLFARYGAKEVAIIVARQSGI